jgi:putative transposase
MCEVMLVSRSGFYKWLNAELSEQAIRKAMIMERIQYHFNDSEKRYGSPKITQMLLKEKIQVAERTVGNYMKEMGLRSCVSRAFKVQTTDSRHDLAVAPNILNQQFKVIHPNKVWVADITYIACREGRLYLASILDLCTREIVGWRLGRRMTTKLVMEALEAAYEAKKPTIGLLHHSDRGAQYASEEYRNKLNEYNMSASMSRKGNCYDNACIESFHSLLKKELIYCTKFKTKQEAHQAIFRYIEFFYNRKRIHSALDYLSPVQYAALFYNQQIS